MVADTHYFHVLVYSPEGKLLETLGGKKGEKPGEFGFVTGTAQDRAGQLLRFRIRRVRPHPEVHARRPLPAANGAATAPSPASSSARRSSVFDADDHLWVTDACNHRIQVFDREGKLLQSWGTQGSEPGELYYPYDIVLAPNDTLYVCEYRQQPRAEIHPRRPLAGLLGPRGTRPRANSSIPGAGPRQPRNGSMCWIRAIIGYNALQDGMTDDTSATILSFARARATWLLLPCLPRALVA